MDDNVRERNQEAELVREERAAFADERHDQAVFRAERIVWYIAGLIATLLGLRIILALMGANMQNAFASFVYTVSDPFVAPFRGLLQVGEFQAGVARLEFETLIAMLVYLLIGWGIARLVALARREPPVRA